jgi:hypothetical protein
MKGKKYHTVGTFPKSYCKNLRKRQNRYPIIHKYMIAHFPVLVPVRKRTRFTNLCKWYSWPKHHARESLAETCLFTTNKCKFMVKIIAQSFLFTTNKCKFMVKIIAQSLTKSMPQVPVHMTINIDTNSRWVCLNDQINNRKRLRDISIWTFQRFNVMMKYKYLFSLVHKAVHLISQKWLCNYLYHKLTFISSEQTGFAMW